MPDWMTEQVENMVHVHEREEARCARWASEDAGEFDDYYAEREAAKRDWDRDEAEWEADGPFEGYDDE